MALKCKFDIMAISETCACEDSTYNYGITRYEVFHTTRNHRNGGGVACYVNNDLAYKFIPQKSFAIDDVLECVRRFKKYNCTLSIQNSRF